MNNLLGWIAVSFALGIIFARFINLGLTWLYFLTVIFMALSFISLRFKRRFLIFILLSVLFLGSLLARNKDLIAKSDILNFYAGLNKNEFVLNGIIDSNPVRSGSKQIFLFSPSELENASLRQSCSGLITATVFSSEKLEYLDRLSLTGSIYKPFFKGAKYQPSGLKLSASRIVALDKFTGFNLKRFSYKLAKSFSEKIDVYFNKDHAAILKAMVIGSKAGIPSAVNLTMMRTGTVHILVVSGFNVGLVVLFVGIILKIARVKKIIRFFIISFLLLIYLFLTGASNPVARATIMAICILGAYYFRRQGDIFNALGLSAIIILVFSPRQVFDIGFQLSFASVFFIAYLYPILKERLNIENLKSPILKYLSEGFLVSFSAWIGTAGLIAYYFRIISLISPLANIFIVPIASLITVCGFTFLVFAYIFLPIADQFKAVIDILVVILLYLNNFFANFWFSSLFLSR